MGSFDMACAVSGLSLGGSQPVKMFFIIESGYRDSLCYSTSQNRICSFGVNMTYDDYGRYEFDETQPEYKDFLRLIEEQGVYVPEGENRFHEKEFDPKNPEHLKSDYLFDLMYHNRVKFKGLFSQKELVVHPYPIHRHIFEQVCMTPFDHWRLGDNIGRDNICDHLKRNVDERQNDFREIVKELSSVSLDKGEITQELFDVRVEHFRDRYCRVDSSSLELDEFFYRTYDVNPFIEENGLDRFWERVAELHLLRNTLDENRIMVVPTMSAGQEWGFEDSIKFHKGCMDVALNLKRSWDEEYGEEDEEL